MRNRNPSSDQGMSQGPSTLAGLQRLAVFVLSKLAQAGWVLKALHALSANIIFTMCFKDFCTGNHKRFRKQKIRLCVAGRDKSAANDAHLLVECSRHSLLRTLQCTVACGIALFSCTYGIDDVENLRDHT